MQPMVSFMRSSGADAPHLVFDRAARRRALARARLGAAGHLHRRAALDVVDRLETVTRSFETAAVFGLAAPLLIDALTPACGVGRLVRIAPVEARAGEARPHAVGDEETSPLAENRWDLIVSLLSLHALNDAPGALVQIRRALKPDGLAIAAAFGGDTLTELRQALLAAETEIEGGAAPHIAPFADTRDYGALLQRAGFALPVTDVDRVRVRYANPLALLSDLRAMGETNVLAVRRRTGLRRAVLMRAMEIYQERFADADGRTPATFDLVTLTGWAPHESQQKPLAPGSAKARLADALQSRERSAGEKAGQ